MLGPGLITVELLTLLGSSLKERHPRPLFAVCYFKGTSQQLKKTKHCCTRKPLLLYERSSYQEMPARVL